MRPKVPNEDYGKSFALRLLIHYMGDYHQPVHMITRVNKEFPTGDGGVAKFPIKPVYETIHSLHAVWDNTAYELLEVEEPPFTDDIWKNLEDKVLMLVNKHPVQYSDYQEFDLEKWATDTYNIVSKTVYVGVKENELVSDEY